MSIFLTLDRLRYTPEGLLGNDVKICDAARWKLIEHT